MQISYYGDGTVLYCIILSEVRLKVRDKDILYFSCVEYKTNNIENSDKENEPKN